jgi:hypothetical protein
MATGAEGHGMLSPKLKNNCISSTGVRSFHGTHWPFLPFPYWFEISSIEPYFVTYASYEVHGELQFIHEVWDFSVAKCPN